METANSIIALQKKALAEKSIVTAENKRSEAVVRHLQSEIGGLSEKMQLLTKEKDAEITRSNDAMIEWMNKYQKSVAQMEEINKFFRWNQEASKMHLDYLQMERERAARDATEKKRQAQEKEQREREDRECKEAERAREEKEQELKREQERLEYLERRSRGMGMGR